MSDLQTAAQQALAFTMRDFASLRDFEAAKAVLHDNLRAALAQQAEPVWMHPWPPVRAQQEEPQTLDEAMRLPRAMAQAYENGYKAGAAAERKRIIQFLTEMQRQVGDGHNYYGVAAMRIREMV